jgi:hypothetical protein
MTPRRNDRVLRPDGRLVIGDLHHGAQATAGPPTQARMVLSRATTMPYVVNCHPLHIAAKPKDATT